VCGNHLCSTFCVLDTFACTGPNNEYDGGTTGCEGTCLGNFDIYLTDAGNDLARLKTSIDRILGKMSI